MKSPERKVIWVPAHPSVGGFSMDNHWRALEDCLPVFHEAGYAPECVLGSPPRDTHRRSRLVRTFSKYLCYPAQVSRISRGTLVHLFDHSFAFLLKYFPKDCRFVVTVHDLVPLMDSAHLTVRQVERFRAGLVNLRHAVRLVAVSRYTADRIEELLEIPSERIRVLPMGVEIGEEPERLPSDPSRLRLLSIGGTHSRKNLKILPEIMEGLIRKGHTIHLTRVGEWLDADLRERLRKSLGENFEERGHLDNERIKEAYCESDVLIFPSYLEGFGLPLLEAMANGCAVVSSNATSLPEVGGNAALYFSPDDPAGAVAQIERFILESDLRKQLRVVGRQRAKELAWQNHARRLAEIYDEV